MRTDSRHNSPQNRIRKLRSVKAGPIELGEDLGGLEYAKPGDITESSNEDYSDWDQERTSLYQENKGIFLTHIITPSKDPDQKYDIYIYLIRHKTTNFADIDKADFFFGHMWGNRLFKEKEKNGMIGVSTSAYGPFLCTCRVFFK